MKICFDSNVAIDILGESPDFFPSYIVYDVVTIRDFEALIPMFTTTDIAYILRRRYLNSQDTKAAIKHLLEMFDIMDGHPQDCIKAINSDMDDYEDALIAFAAERNGVDFIVTRNKKDFRHSPVPALTPEEFVDIYRPENITYTVIERDQFSAS
jgi:predicted nucleic acid-binding protein